MNTVKLLRLTLALMRAHDANTEKFNARYSQSTFAENRDISSPEVLEETLNES